MAKVSERSQGTSRRPTDKVTAAAAAGALATLVVWIVGLAGLDVPAEVTAALTTVLVFLAGYLRPEHHPAS